MAQLLGDAMRTDPANDAVNRPVGRPRKELHSDDMELRDIPKIALDNITPGSEGIVVSDTGIDKDYAEAMAFMEEPVTIRLERTNEKNAAKVHMFAVNGVQKWIPVGTPVDVRRKYLEVIARAQPYNVNTEVIEVEGQDPINNMVRTSSSKYPFSVIHDPNPKGANWLTNLMRTS
jgi:hypothetical protein